MGLKLAVGEEIVKQYNFGGIEVEQSNQRESIYRSLIITNKRIVSRVGNMNAVCQKEMPIRDVCNIHCEYDIPKKKGSIAPLPLLLIGIVGIIIGLIMKDNRMLFMIGGGVLFVVGLIWLIAANSGGKKNATMLIKIAGRSSGNSSITLGDYHVGFGSLGEMELPIGKLVAVTMVDEIGSIILSLQSQENKE